MPPDEIGDHTRLVGTNHIALDVGDVETALEFDQGLFAVDFRGRIEGKAFLDMGDQFVAIAETGRAEPDGPEIVDDARHVGHVVDDADLVASRLEAFGVERLDTTGLDVHDPGATGSRWSSTGTSSSPRPDTSWGDGSGIVREDRGGPRGTRGEGDDASRIGRSVPGRRAMTEASENNAFNLRIVPRSTGYRAPIQRSASVMSFSSTSSSPTFSPPMASPSTSSSSTSSSPTSSSPMASPSTSSSSMSIVPDWLVSD